MRLPFNLTRVLLAAGSAAAIGLLGYGGWSYRELRRENTLLREEVVELNQSLSRVQDKNNVLVQSLQTEQDKNGGFQVKIGEIASIVGNLQKLSATDPELLKKYSKVYFLSENYAPAQLSSIDPQFLYEKNRTQLIHTGVLPHLQGMLDAAKRDGITLQIVSAYRSFYDQATVKAGYAVVYGSGANKFSADQGYSEHQLGTTADFTVPEVDGAFSEFEKSTGYKWLADNAYKFGLVLSYPKNNSYYQSEPWHWRFVGTALANYLHSENKYFYDLDQREIDGYLITIFN